MRVWLDQVQQWEQENPDQVDHVPVQAAQINWREVLRAEITTHATQEEPCDHDHANDDVGPVQAGHGVVNAKIDVSVCGPLGINSWIGMVMRVAFIGMVLIVCMVAFIGMVLIVCMVAFIGMVLIV